jgi:hypothetical protein
MNPDAQFWWSWGVNVAIAVGTIGAVLAALFGDWIRAAIFKPRLTLELASVVGEATTVQLTAPSGESRPEKARYHHLRVANRAAWPKASQVQVYLVRIEEPGPDGTLQVKWAGDVPVKWKFQEIYPLQRTIGPETDLDLCSVVKDK